MEEKELLGRMEQFKQNREENLDENIKIIDIYYCGTIKINDEEKPVYHLAKDIDGSMQYEYYIEENMVAVEQVDSVLPTKYGLDNDIDAQEIFEREEETSLTELEETEENLQKQEVEEIAKTTGIEEQEVMNCVEMGVDQKLEFKTKDTLDIQRKVTATESLRDIIPELREYDKIAVVYSSTNVFTFVGVKANGEKKKIDSIIPIEGVNTGKTVTSINRDGSEIERKQVSALAKVKGREQEGLSVRVGQYGIIETEYVRRTTENEYISAPIENETQKPTKKVVRDVMDKTKNVRMNEEIERVKAEGDKTELDNIDDRDDNDNVNWEYEAGRAKVSVQEFKRIYEDVCEEMGTQLSVKEKINEVHEIIEEQYLLQGKNRDEIN